MTLAQFIFDPNDEVWWIEPADGDGLHEPDNGHFVVDVPDEMLVELVAVRQRYGFLGEELIRRAGLHATEPYMAEICGQFVADRELTAENTTHLDDPELLERLISWQRCTTCGNCRYLHPAEVPASEGSAT